MNIVICAVAIFQSLHGYGSEAFTVSSKYGSTIRSRSSFDRSNRQMRHFAKPKKNMDDIRREIEEMGGDPSFLTDDDLIEADFQDDDDGDDAFLMPSMSLMAGMEGMSDVLSAKIGGDDQNDNKDKDKDIVPDAKDMKSYAGSNRQTRNVTKPKKNMDDIRREIEEMGGDPSFLTDDDLIEADFQDDDDGDDAFLMPSMSLMAGMEGMSDVLSAKIGGDDQNDNKDKDIVPNVKDMKSYAGSNRLTGNVADSTRSTDDIRREIEEMGGDPAFLADDDMEGADIKSGDAKEEVAVAEKRVFLWDGEVIENAYFDE